MNVSIVHTGNGAHINVGWNGEPIIKKLKSGLGSGLYFAAQHLQRKIKKDISEWGSDPVGPGLRFRERHSAPYDPPLRQTGELYESIQVESSRANLTAMVYSDDPKAPTLEFGGRYLTLFHKRAKWRLINPFKHIIDIAPRPFLGPVFEREQSKVVEIIAKYASR